jgi:hypothetical protein
MQEKKLTRADGRQLVQKEVMMNGKTFADCSKFDLYLIIMHMRDFIVKNAKEREENTFKFKLKKLFKI